MTGCLSWPLREYRPLIKTANLEAVAAVFSLSGLDGESAAVVCLIISAAPAIMTLRTCNVDVKLVKSV